MKKLFTTLFILLCISVIAQDIPPTLHSSENLFEHEQKFKTWLSSQPKGTKGWKWMARYENELLKRIYNEGLMPSNELLLQNHARLSSLENENLRKSAEPTWSPAGPYGNTSLFGIGRVNCIAFHPKDSLTFYIGFGQGGIWKTTNGGKSYTPMGDKLPILRISDIEIDPNNPETLFISVSDFAYIGYDLYTADRKRNTYYGIGVWKSTDGGKTWKETGLKNKLDEGLVSITRTIWVNPKNSKEVVVIGAKGIFKSYDGGDSWKNVFDKMGSSIVQHPAKSNILYATGVYVATTKQGEAGIWRSEDAGNTWQFVESGIGSKIVQRTEMAFSPSNPDLVYAVTCDLNNGFEGFYRSYNGGLTWEKSAFRGNLLSTVYNGFGGQGFYDLCILVHPTNPKKVYVGGLILNETADGGDSWVRSTGYYTIHPDQHYLAYNQLNKTFYVCNDGGVYATKNIIPNVFQNLSWEFICDGINATSCYRIGVSENGQEILAGAQDNNMYLKQANQNVWSNEFGGDGMEGFLADKFVYGSYQYGFVTFFDRNDPNKAERQVFPPTNASDTGEWTTPFIYNKSSNQVYIAGGNVYKIALGEEANKLSLISNFRPFGTSRTPQVSTALAVPKNNPDIVYVAKKNTPISKLPAELWKTTNGGGVWESITNNIYKDAYVTYLAVDDDNPNRIWATLSNFVEGQKVFYSIDGGMNWENISYNLPNLPANAIAYQSDANSEILYVGMDIGVYYLVEGSKEWKPLLGNLPNVIIQELEINYTTKKLYAATFGRGIWVTDLLTEKTIQAESIYAMNATLYPNGVGNRGSFTIKTDYSNVEKMQVVDIMGRIRYEEELKPKALKFGKRFELSRDLDGGLYFIRLIEGNQTKVLKMVVE